MVDRGRFLIARRCECRWRKLRGMRRRPERGPLSVRTRTVSKIAPFNGSSRPAPREKAAFGLVSTLER